MTYVIVNKSMDGFFNPEKGWVNAIADAAFYDSDIIGDITLPEDGFWLAEAACHVVLGYGFPDPEERDVESECDNNWSPSDVADTRELYCDPLPVGGLEQKDLVSDLLPLMHRWSSVVIVETIGKILRAEFGNRTNADDNGTADYRHGRVDVVEMLSNLLLSAARGARIQIEDGFCLRRQYELSSDCQAEQEVGYMVPSNDDWESLLDVSPPMQKVRDRFESLSGLFSLSDEMD